MIPWSSVPDLLCEEQVTGGLRLATFPGAQISVPYRVSVPYRATGKGGSRGSCLSELWPVLYLAAERAPNILAAQAKRRTWLLRGPSARCLREGCRPPRSGDGAGAAFTLGLVPGP